MILIALGANLPSPRYGPPLAICEAALDCLTRDGTIVVARRAPWYRSAPIPASDQPPYVNGVAQLITQRDPVSLLARLHAVEQAFGRTRAAPNAARTLDLDLLAHGDYVVHEKDLQLPHPRMHERGFVLVPLCDIAADWRHPERDLTARQMLEALTPGYSVEPIG